MNKEIEAIFIGGRYDGLVFTHDELEKLEVTGKLSNDSELRAKGIVCHREELDDQPEIEGYIGPMLDGEMLRYETQEVYDLMFD